MSSESSSSDESCQPQRLKRPVCREFVWLKELPNCIPRGNAWDKMNREGRVKELAFSTLWSAGKMEEIILNGFPALRGADTKRLRFYKSESRGSKLQKVCTGIPNGKELLQYFGKAKSKKILIHLKRYSPTSTSNTTSTSTSPSTSGSTSTSSSAFTTGSTSTSTSRFTSISTSTSTSTCTSAPVTTTVVSTAASSPRPATASRSSISVNSSLSLASTSTLRSVAKTPTIVQPVISSDWSVAGEIDEDLEPTGIDTSTCASYDHCGRVVEVLRCVAIFKKNASEVPVFLNSTFEEVCYQAAEDRKVLVLAVIHSSDATSTQHIARLLGGISASNEIYFWVAGAETSSGKLVKKKFGEQSRDGELFVLAPTRSTTNPILVDRFSGETLKEAHFETISEAVERASSALVSLEFECSTLENERVLQEEQNKEYTETLKTDKRKRVMRAREGRTLEEPKEEYWEIKVKCADGTIKSRKFSKKGTYQEVYDWIGVAVEEENFTLHRRGAGFIGEICNHDENLSGDETLLLIVRSQSDAGNLLQSEVSFYGNYEEMEQDLAKTLQDFSGNEMSQDEENTHEDEDFSGNEENTHLHQERETKKQKCSDEKEESRREQPSVIKRPDEETPSMGEGTGQPPVTKRPTEEQPSMDEGIVKEKKKRKRRKRNRQEMKEGIEKEEADGKNEGN